MKKKSERIIKGSRRVRKTIMEVKQDCRRRRDEEQDGKGAAESSERILLLLLILL